MQGKIRVSFEHKRDAAINGKLVINVCSAEDLTSKVSEQWGEGHCCHCCH